MSPLQRRSLLLIAASLATSSSLIAADPIAAKKAENMQRHLLQGPQLSAFIRGKRIYIISPFKHQRGIHSYFSRNGRFRDFRHNEVTEGTYIILEDQVCISAAGFYRCLRFYRVADGFIMTASDGNAEYGIVSENEDQ